MAFDHRLAVRIAFILLGPVSAAMAQDAAPKLAFPLDCKLGETCFVQNYVDHDTGPGALDFSCGPLTYDKHDGTDIALPDRAAMAKGVAVLAAAAGRVRGVRDGMADVSIREPNAPDIKGRECGNGVVIQHEGGWETQYCHMRNGSIVVKAGQDVAAGAQLGLVGLSGDTEFPHMHLRVSRQGTVVDPFDAKPQTASCDLTPSSDSLWADKVGYVAGGLVTAGFAAEEPQPAKMASGVYAAPGLSSTAPILFWIEAYGVREGDEHRLKIIGPNGVPITNANVQSKRTQARQQQWIGRKPPQSGWPVGAYRGEYQLVRNGQVLVQTTREAELK